MGIMALTILIGIYSLYRVSITCKAYSKPDEPTSFMNSSLSAKETAQNDKYLKTMCPDLLEAAKADEYKKQMNFIVTKPTTNDGLEFAVTLFSQFSYRKLKLIEPLVKNWEGPVVLTFYGTTKEAKRLKTYVEASPILSTSTTVYHFVQRRGELYPFNILRNVALKTVTTQFVFMADVDFVTKPGMHGSVRESLNRVNNSHPERTAFIVPAFRAGTNDSSIIPSVLDNFPHSKMELIKLWELRKIIPYGHQGWPVEERNTDYSRWKVASEGYKVPYEDHYEPWVILKTAIAPLYDERFVGYGYDKASYNFELAARGFQFFVLPNEFMVHLPHAPTPPEMLFRSWLRLTEYCRRLVRGTFYVDMGKRHGNAANALLSTVPRCAATVDATNENLILPCAY